MTGGEIEVQEYRGFYFRYIGHVVFIAHQLSFCNSHISSDPPIGNVVYLIWCITCSPVCYMDRISSLEDLECT